MADKLFVVACVRGNLEEIETLVAAGADVNAVDANGATACHIAVTTSNIPLLQLLIDEGADLNAREYPDVGGYTPLHYAVANNDVEAVELLLSSDADANIGDYTSGFTPLHVAARSKANEAAKLLVAKGADVHKRDDMGNNASYWANELKNAEFLAIPGIPPPATALPEERAASLAHGAKQSSLLTGKGAKKKPKRGKKKATKKK